MKKLLHFIPGIGLFAAVAIYAQTSAEGEGNNLYATVKQGGPLMIVLVLLALIAVTIIIERLIFFTRNGAWGNKRVSTLLTGAVENKVQGYREDVEDTLRTDLNIYTNSLENGLALLSGIGNMSPIVGFLGTVIGMINAFGAIAAATTVNAKVVAVGIQIALVTTAGGLVVAAPALAAYYFLAHIVQVRVNAGEELIVDLSAQYPSLSSALKSDKSSSEFIGV